MIEKTALLAALLFFPAQGHARAYDMYRSDYPKGAFCQAIGAACAADDDLENAFFQNPATLATGKSDWNFDGELASKTNLEPGMAEGNVVGETEADGGIAMSTGRFGVGISATQLKDSVDGTITMYDNANLPVRTGISARAKLQQINVPFGLRVSRRLALGLTFSFLNHSQSFGIKNAIDQAGNNPAATAFGLAAGGLLDLDRHSRLGTWFRIPTTLYERAQFRATVASTTLTYTEDFALHFPWIWAVGYAVDLRGRLSLYLENDLVGTTASGYLLSYNTISSAVGDQNLVAKGRKVVAEPHWGLRQGLTPKLTAHFGGYYESSRWADLPGRLHTTGGVSYRLGDLLEVIGGVDVARHFSQLLLTFR